MRFNRATACIVRMLHLAAHGRGFQIVCRRRSIRARLSADELTAKIFVIPLAIGCPIGYGIGGVDGLPKRLVMLMPVGNGVRQLVRHFVTLIRHAVGIGISGEQIPALEHVTVLDGVVDDKGGAVARVDRLYAVTVVQIKLHQVIQAVKIAFKHGTAVGSHALGDVVHLRKACIVPGMGDDIGVGNNRTGFRLVRVVERHVLGVEVVTHVLEEIADRKVYLDRLVKDADLHVCLQIRIAERHLRGVGFDLIHGTRVVGIVEGRKAQEGRRHNGLRKVASLFNGGHVGAENRRLNARLPEGLEVKVFDGYGNVLGFTVARHAARRAEEAAAPPCKNGCALLSCALLGHDLLGLNRLGLLLLGRRDQHTQRGAIVLFAFRVGNHAAHKRGVGLVQHLAKDHLGDLTGLFDLVVNIDPERHIALHQHLPLVGGGSKVLNLDLQHALFVARQSQVGDLAAIQRDAHGGGSVLRIDYQRSDIQIQRKQRCHAQDHCQYSFFHVCSHSLSRNRCPRRGGGLEAVGLHGRGS